ncbi:hypothetical protein G173_gp134 [Erwinia phage phiEaH2]|uniref:Uncharacterized protein n=1 Tax=Erwinia phage phiEaH2 TaxID=1029988 RepID=J7KE28_9CAUD|nr:hypothetical protein G173_gp134 [Erwinia phage phiEaH2]AFQ96679.1 hypothetical protein [Erwinia phage phiEaH2]
MRLIVDFALSASRNNLNIALTALRKEVQFELHDKLAEYENKYSEEQGGEEVAILDVDAMVNSLIGQMEDALMSVVHYPHILRVNDAQSEIETVMNEAFRRAVETITRIRKTDVKELYVSIIRKDGNMVINDTVTWPDVLDDEVILRLNNIFRQAQTKVIDICQSELHYLAVMYDKELE